MSGSKTLDAWRGCGLLALAVWLVTIPAAAMAQAPSAGQAADGWRVCASEGQTCTFDRRTVVRYGAEPRWSSRVVAGNIDCSNDAFGDPAPQVPKQCQVRDYASSTGASGGWTICAAEGEICRFRGLTEVRFGHGGQFTTRSAFGQVRCDVESFGDPAFGVTKQCEVRSSAVLVGPQRPGEGHDGWGGGTANEWRYCAPEGGTCLVNGRAEVRFGDGRRFATRTVSGDVACEVQRFGDPARGVVKHCEVRASGWLGEGSNGVWSRCAGEGERCTFTGQAQVRYGTQGRYAYRGAFNGLTCETAAFGTDPFVGRVKACEIRR